MTFFRIVNRLTAKWWQGLALDAQDACQKAGFIQGDCWIRYSPSGRGGDWSSWIKLSKKIEHPRCHCGAYCREVYDRCSEKYIWGCSFCGCRFKLTGELEPNIFCPFTVLIAMERELPPCHCKLRDG